MEDMHIFLPKPYKKEQITIRIRAELLEEIDRFAAGANLSRSAFISQCIKYAIEHIAPGAGEQW